jgi:hypothetical protein
VQLKDINSEAVATIEKHAKNNIELTLDGVIDFLNERHKDLSSYYKVFKEQFVVCWAGNQKKVGGETYFSRVDIELINEQVKLFYSEFDDITITHDDHSFTTIEYVQLGLNTPQKYYPLEKVVITFLDNGTYTIQSDLIFEPPLYDKKTLHHFYNANIALIKKVGGNVELTPNEKRDLDLLSDTLLICHINGFEEAKEVMENAKPIFKQYDIAVYRSLKESLRIIRKLTYN